MVTRLNGFSLGVFAIVVATAIAFGAFPAAATDKATLRLDWVNSGYHAIWYYGVDKGIFQKAGIDLEVLEGKGSGAGSGSVISGMRRSAIRRAVPRRRSFRRCSRRRDSKARPSS